MSYQAQGRLIAIIELIVCGCSLLGVVVGSIMFSMKKVEWAKDEAMLDKYPNLREFLDSRTSEQAMAFLIPGIYLTVQMILAGVLYIGASELKSGLLKAWTTLTLVVAGVGLVFSAFGIMASDNKTVPIALSAFGYVFTGWSVWVGYSLSKQGKE